MGLYLENSGWLNAMRPSGYNRTAATYVTVGVDEAANVVTVLYTYRSEGGGSDPDPDPTPTPDPDPDPDPDPVPDPGLDIPDEDVPMGELPDLTEDPGMEIPDEEVPLAEAPATGDQLMSWVLAAAVSGIGLVWLAIMGKKRKDEEA